MTSDFSEFESVRRHHPGHAQPAAAGRLPHCIRRQMQGCLVEVSQLVSPPDCTLVMSFLMTAAS